VAPCSLVQTSRASASSRPGGGIFPVISHSARAQDSDKIPVAMARAILGCSPARVAQAVCAQAAARVTPAWWISHDRGL